MCSVFAYAPYAFACCCWQLSSAVPDEASPSARSFQLRCVRVQDEAKGKRVWELSEKLCGITAAAPAKQKQMATA